MYGRDDVELALLALEKGMGAAKLVGCSEATVRNRERGRLPCSCLPAPGTMPARASGGKGAHGEGDLRPAGERAAGRPGAGPDREHPAQGGDRGPKSGRLGVGFDLEQEQVRARGEIEAGGRPAPPPDHRFLEDIEELL